MSSSPSSTIWIIGIDGSPESHAAFMHAVRLNEHHSPFLLCCFYDSPRRSTMREREKETDDSPSRQRAASILETYVGLALQYSIPSRVHLSSNKNIGEELCSLITKEKQHLQREEKDLKVNCYLVIGSRGLGKAQGILLGSVSSYCIRNATCPVLVVNRQTVQSSGDEILSLPPISSQSSMLARFNNFSLSPTLEEREKLITNQISPFQKYKLTGNWVLPSSTTVESEPYSQFVSHLISSSKISLRNEYVTPYTSSFTLQNTGRSLSPFSRLLTRSYHHQEPPQGFSPPNSRPNSVSFQDDQSPVANTQETTSQSGSVFPFSTTLSSNLPLSLGGVEPGGPRPIDYFLFAISSSLVTAYVSRLTEELVSLVSLSVKTSLTCDHGYTLGLYSHDTFHSSLSIQIKLLTTDSRSAKPTYSHIPLASSSPTNSSDLPGSGSPSSPSKRHSISDRDSRSVRSNSPIPSSSSPSSSFSPPYTLLSSPSLITKHYLLELFDDCYHRTPELWVLRNHPDINHLFTVLQPVSNTTSTHSLSGDEQAVPETEASTSSPNEGSLPSHPQLPEALKTSFSSRDYVFLDAHAHTLNNVILCPDRRSHRKSEPNSVEPTSPPPTLSIPPPSSSSEQTSTSTSTSNPENGNEIKNSVSEPKETTKESTKEEENEMKDVIVHTGEWVLDEGNEDGNSGQYKGKLHFPFIQKQDGKEVEIEKELELVVGDMKEQLKSIDLFLFSLAGSYLSTFVMSSSQEKIILNHASINVMLDLNRNRIHGLNRSEQAIHKIVFDTHVSTNEDPSLVKRTAQIARQRCPVHALLTSPTYLHVDIDHLNPTEI